MTTAATTPGESRSRTASAIVLGADAVLAAHPATAVQLAHACLRAGYSTVIPATWGDELLATETIRQLRASDARPLVYCACPHVSDRLLDVGDDLAPFLISLVSPPVATARHLRELARGEPLEITFVGACPSGNDAAIDAQFTPADFLAMLAHRGIVLLDQPEVFDSVLSPDRRRHRSLPGGVPTSETLWSDAGRRALIEIADTEALTELAQHLASGEPALLDLGPALGCTCSGAVPGAPPESARSAVCALEPPRSTGEIIEPSLLLQLSRPLRPLTGARESKPVSTPLRESSVPDVPVQRVSTAIEVASDQSSFDRVDQPEPSASIPAPTEAEQFPDTDVSSPKPFTSHRRRSTTAAVRAAAGSLPVTNSGEGRALPRAYVARRSSRRRGSETGHAELEATPSEKQESGGGGTAASHGLRHSHSGPSALPRNGGGSNRVFASVPIAVARPAGRETEPTTPAPPTGAEPAAPTEPVSASVETESAAAPSPGTPSGRSELVMAPIVALRERARDFARRSEERPVYLGVLIAIVAVLSIALGMAAGRALRGATPVTADPAEHGAAADSVFGTSAPDQGTPVDDVRQAEPRTPSNRAPGGETTPRTPAPDRPQTRRAPGSDAIQQSAAGNVAPEVTSRMRSGIAQPRGTTSLDRAAPGAAVRDSLAADSMRRGAARTDSVRSDSLERDAARRRPVAGDSVVRTSRDSTPLVRLGLTTTDSLFQRQRDELQRELEDRQRRIDSLQRWLDSARRVSPPPPTTPPPST